MINKINAALLKNLGKLLEDTFSTMKHPSTVDVSKFIEAVKCE